MERIGGSAATALVLFMFLAAAAAAISIQAVPVNAQDCLVNHTVLCGSNIGACQQGIRSCQNGQWSDCRNDVEPETEICNNGLDDDCDGFTDECGSFVWMIMLGLGMLLFALGIAIANKWTD
jgi:hypothetical protein